MTVADTTPYPWPFDRVVDPARTALVLTGAGPRWAGRTPGDPAATDRLDQLRALAATSAIVEVLVTHDEPSPRPVALPSGPTAELLVPAPDSLRVHASGIDGFYGSNLDAVLRRTGRTHILLAGHGLETTVHSTMRRANDRGYECLLVADATLALDPSLRTAAISSIEMSGGIFGAVGLTAAVLDAYRSTLEPDPATLENTT